MKKNSLEDILAEVNKGFAELNKKMADSSAPEDTNPVNAALNKIAKEHQEQCDHGVVFDAEKAQHMKTAYEVRAAYPRLMGNCPKGCGFIGIAYASFKHYIYGDW